MQVGANRSLPPPDEGPVNPYHRVPPGTYALTHRSALGGRHDGSHISAEEMADLERFGDLDELLRRIRQARSLVRPLAGPDGGFIEY